MTILEYMAEQREQIRKRHSGEVYYYQSAKEKSSPVLLNERSSERIFEEIDAMRGLNVEGRRFYARRGGSKIFA